MRLPLSYFDQINQPLSRNIQEFDHLNKINRDATRRWSMISESGVPTPYYIGDWLARGSVREDDMGAFLTHALNGRWWGDPNAYQQLDTANPINRFCNHFYDPVNNRALQLGLPQSIIACGLGEVFGSAVQWSLGSNTVDGTGTPDTNRRNAFSILDAREAQWRALTGLDKTMTPRAEAQPMGNPSSAKDFT